MSFLGGLFGSAPKAPDPYKVAAAQTQTNIDTAREQAKLNAVNRYGPTGSTEFQFDPVTGAPTGQTVTLTPELQSLLNSQIGNQQGISDATLKALGMLPQTPFDASGINTDNIAKTSFDKQMALLQPQFDQAAKNNEVSWSDRGIPLGSEIYTDEANRFDTAKNNAMTQASRQAELDAGNEAQRQFANALTQYNLPLQQLQGLSGVSQPAQQPGYAPQAQTSVAPTNLSGDVWNAYQAQTQQANAANQNLFGLGASIISLL